MSDNPQPAAKSSRKLGILLALASTLVTLAAACGAGEAYLRYRERHRTTAPSMPMMFYQHNHYGHALIRNAHYYDWVHTNSAGFRGTREYALDKKPGVTRVMVVGSSTAFDSFVGRDEAAWPAQLELKLTALVGSPIEVINAGVPGYTIVVDLDRLLTELYKYHPDVLIFYEGHNDLIGSMRGSDESMPTGNRPDEVPTSTPWGKWLTEHSVLYSKVALRLRATLSQRRGAQVLQRQSADTARLAAKTVEYAAEKFSRDMSAFLATTQAMGWRVVVPQLVHMSGAGSLTETDQSVRAIWSNTVSLATPETVLQTYVRFDSVATSLAQRYGAVHIPTVSFELKGPEWYSEQDPIHFNAKGAERMADRLAQALVSAGVFAAKGAVPTPSR